MKVQIPYNTPVLLIAFNRPQYMREVIEAIRKVQPKSFYIAVDGPRQGVEADVVAQNEIREIIKLIDWDCNLHTLFRDENLGCGWGPAQAITWALTNEDRIIVLEDDCVPNQSFFAFCDAMLEKYKDDERIGIISGRSYQHGSKYFNNQDYIFTNYAHTLGWATWKRCWDRFDIWMKDFPEFLENGGAYNVMPVKEAAKHANKHLAKIYGRIQQEVTHSWDSQCQYMFWKNSQLGIVPSKNLIKYIGWWGTHDFGIESEHENIQTEEMPDNLKHPELIMLNAGYERLHYRTHIKIGNPSIIVRAFRKLIREIKAIWKRLR